MIVQVTQHLTCCFISSYSSAKDIEVEGVNRNVDVINVNGKEQVTATEIDRLLAGTCPQLPLQLDGVAIC